MERGQGDSFAGYNEGKATSIWNTVLIFLHSVKNWPVEWAQSAPVEKH